MKIVYVLVLLGLGFSVGAFAGSDDKKGKKLAMGSPAPPFSLPGSDGKTHSLSDHAGRRAVVIAWFPKAFTGG